MRAVEPPFDLGVRAAQSGTDLFARHAPPLALPFHGVVGGYDARRPHAENLFQPLLALQTSVRVAALRGFDRKALAASRAKK